MHFQHPAILLLLWLLPGVAALLVVAQKRRLAAARRFVEQPMIARLMPELRGSRPWIKGILLLSGVTLLIVAAAQPQYGVYYEKVKPQHGVDCFILFDVSRSMLAEDVAPNRLGRAKSDIRDLLTKLGGDRVGLIVFAGKPVLKVPLTSDAGFFDTVLDEIDTRSAPRGGTLIGDAIRKALDSLPPRGDHDQVLVLLTDGEDQDSYPLEAAKQAAERGVQIFTVGLGDSSEGARIPLRNAAGKIDYVKDDGKEHWSKTDQSVLQQIASLTGGAHVAAGTRTYDLGQIYEDRLAELTRGELQQQVERRRFNDQYQVFLALALVLLAAERLLPVCSEAVRRADRALVMLLVACVFGFSSLGAAPAEAAFNSAAQKVEEGVTAFRGGDFKTASEAFGAAAEALPNDLRIAFDQGCAFAAQGETDKAIEQFQLAAAAQDRSLAATAQYNLGCLAIAKGKAKFGEKPEEATPEARKEGLESFELATGHLHDCLSVDPEHVDARYNIEAIRLWTKHMREVWRNRDAQKRRQDMNLLQFLQWLEAQQRELREKNHPLASEKPSPRRREAIRSLENGQRELSEEIEPLKEKINAALTTPTSPAPGSAPGQPAAAPQPPGPEVQRALSLLNNLADEAHTAMNTAADTLATQKLSEAAKPQGEAVEKIDAIFMLVSPFVELVKKGIATEERLIAQSSAATSAAKGNGKEGDNAEEGKDDGNKTPGDNGQADWPDAAWNQRFISNYGQVLAAKAKRELEQLAQTTAASPGTQQQAMPPEKQEALSSDKDNEKEGENGGESADQAKARQAQDDMKRALQAGIDLAPKVVQLSDEAAAQLDASHPDTALPPQQETLKLLQEMLPKQEQKNDQKNKDQQDKNQQDKDKKDQQDQKNQDKQDQQKKDQDKDKKDEKDKDEQAKQDQKNKGQQQKNQDKQADEQPKKAKNPSEQQAENEMRKVRQRQQDRREMEKALLEKLYRPERVDKDW